VPYTFKHGDRPLEGVTIQRAVGRGGFGEVYYALTDSGKQVALKYLRENPEVELRGIGHVMNLKSPYLVTIYDVRSNEAGEPFVIMEYVSGPSLRELLIAEPGGMGPQKAAFFVAGIAKGLAYLHERGIVHRDLKPANIFYDDGYVKIGDYGLSKHISVSKHSGQTVSVGTVHYMAPEIGSGSYTKAIDVYALGVILYEMLTGRLPFTGSSMGEILMRHLRDRPDLAGVPETFAPIIAKALAKNPAERYQDANEMLAAVTDLAEVSDSVSSFDASVLTRVPRAAAPDDADPTATSPAGRRPTVDARDLPTLDELPDRLQRKMDRLRAKLEKKAARIEEHAARIGERYGGRHAAGAAPAGGDTARPPARYERGGHILVLIAVGAALAGGLAFFHGVPFRTQHALGFAFYLAGGTFGILAAHHRVVRRVAGDGDLLDRLIYGAFAGLCMVPANMYARERLHDAGMASLIFAPIAAAVLCRWRNRVEAGRAGRVAARSLVWPAIIGLVVGAALHSPGRSSWLYAVAPPQHVTPWLAAGLCAGIALLTQIAAGLWPHAAPRRLAPGNGSARRAPASGAATDPRVGRPSEPPAEASGPAAPQPQSAPAPIVIEAMPTWSRAWKIALLVVVLVGLGLGLLCVPIVSVRPAPVAIYTRNPAAPSPRTPLRSRSEPRMSEPTTRGQGVPTALFGEWLEESPLQGPALPRGAAPGSGVLTIRPNHEFTFVVRVPDATGEQVGRPEVSVPEIGGVWETVGDQFRFQRHTSRNFNDDTDRWRQPVTAKLREGDSDRLEVQTQGGLLVRFRKAPAETGRGESR